MRTTFDQTQDIQIAVKALKNQASNIVRGFQNIYALRNSSTAERNINTIQRRYIEQTHEFLSEHSVYDIVVSEEINTHNSNQTYWVINEFDGKLNFITKNPVISMRIDLFNATECLLSVILSPLLHEFITCAKDIGCNVEANNVNYGRRYAQREISISPIIITNDTNLKFPQNAIFKNIYNDSLAIAYTACGYCSGVYLKDPSAHLIKVGRMFANECDASFNIQDNAISMAHNVQDIFVNKSAF